MKHIIPVVVGSIFLSVGISHLLFKYMDINVPPSIVGIFLVLTYIGVVNYFDDDVGDE